MTISSQKAFSIIEVMIGVFIFSLWLVAIYALLVSSLSLSEYNKNAIIASQLAVEQVEIMRNIRDTNYKTVSAWDNTPSGGSITEGYFRVENNPMNGVARIEAISGFVEGESQMNAMQDYRLCLSSENKYTYDCNGPSETQFYRYLQIEDIWENKFLLISRVIWYARWYHEFDIQTVITDWRRL